MARAQAWAGHTLDDLARACQSRLPSDLRGHKGLLGDLLECVLGASAASRPEPDFVELGIELKTVPIDARGRPCESTHVCAVTLDELVGQTWARSSVRHKLARVLWMPLEATPSVPLARRRLGCPRLWSPDAAQEAVLRQDWEEHMELMTTGRFDELDARRGTYLQVRPKAANSRSLARASDRRGHFTATLPRGFYLRASFTRAILGQAS